MEGVLRWFQELNLARFSISDLPLFIQILVSLLIVFIFFKLIISLEKSILIRVYNKTPFIKNFLTILFRRPFLVHQAKKASKWKDYSIAGKIYEQIGEYRKAIKMYTKGEDFLSLAEVYERLGNFREAEQIYLEYGYSDKIIGAYLSSGKIREAIDFCKIHHKYSEAAHLLLVLKKWDEAGKLFEQEKLYLEAGKAFEKAGDFERASLNYEKWYRENKESIRKDKEKEKKFKELIELLEKSGEIDKCLELLIEQNKIEEAAELSKRQGQLDQAAEYYRKAGNFLKAAETYKKLNLVEEEYLMLGENCLAQNKIKEAAQWFEKGKDYDRAARLYEWENEDLKAAECHYKNRSYILAADNYLRAGEKEKAAEAYELGKDFHQAAKIFYQLGNLEKALILFELTEDYYQAGLVASQLGEEEKALSFLERVPFESKNFSSANFISGKIYLKRKKLSQAEEKFLKAINNETLNPNNMEYYYFLAEVYEKSRRYDEAKTVFQKIFDEDQNFRDVQKKIDQIEEKIQDQVKLEKAVEDSSERYQILEKIGEGGMGAVYKAEDLVLKRCVALKTLNKDFLTRKKAVERFFSEARTAASLSHPNIVTIYDVGQIKDNYFISMEFMEGETFIDYLNRRGKLTIPQIVFVAFYLFNALDYAHKKGIIHRDIKPHNLMLTKDKQVKVMDFGIAIILTGESKEMTYSGTPYYMAPEQILGTSIDRRTDIYSAGATLYHLITGRPPFAEGDVFSHHLSKKPVPLSKLRPDIPEMLEKIILKCLEKDKKNRYQSAEEIIDELRKIKI